MVVCKCRKATKLYCFVHKVPVCGECICFPEHQICVVRTYSEWVIDGEYDWPPSCCKCNAVLEEGTDPQTTRLGCLHVIHTNCLISHIKSFPSHTAPAGYVCPTCPTPEGLSMFVDDGLVLCCPVIEKHRLTQRKTLEMNLLWPPKNFKDSGSCLHSKLKDAVVQTDLEKNVFGSHQVSMATPERGPPSFSSEPLKGLPGTGGAEGVNNETSGATDNIVEIGGSPTSSLSVNHEYIKAGSPSAGAGTRKGAVNVERQNSEISYFADDEDGNRKKYTRRGSFRHKFMRALLPFWSSALPTLPVTAPTRRDSLNADDGTEGRVRHKRSSRMDPRKILLFIAIMACMATMGILYYRLAQGTLGLGQEVSNDER